MIFHIPTVANTILTETQIQSISELNSTATPPNFNTGNDIEDIIYQKDAVLDAEISLSNYTDVNSTSSNVTESTTQGPRLDQKRTENSEILKATEPLSTEKPCSLDCGPGGGCLMRDTGSACLCPLGRGGERCEKGNVFQKVK